MLNRDTLKVGDKVILDVKFVAEHSYDLSHLSNHIKSGNKPIKITSIDNYPNTVGWVITISDLHNNNKYSPEWFIPYKEKKPKKKTYIQLQDAQAKDIFKKHGHTNSWHEVWGVLDEEFMELKAEIMKKSEDRDPKRILAELLDISSYCQKAAESMKLV